jgi:hypothetical protein
MAQIFAELDLISLTMKTWSGDFQSPNRRLETAAPMFNLPSFQSACLVFARRRVDHPLLAA